MAFEIKVEAQTAGEDVGKWLDFRNVLPTSRAAYSAYVAKLIEAVMYGRIEINADSSITHNLNVPITNKESGSVIFSKLNYVARLTAGALSDCLRGLNSGSDIDNSIAYGAALTGENSGIISMMDSSDLVILSAVGVFFSV